MRQPYKLKDGSIVPGCTTICNMLDKPQLIDWAWKLGKQGKDWRAERDNAGDIGTLAHAMIMGYWKEEWPTLQQYPKEQLEAAMIPYNTFLENIAKKQLYTPVLIEQPLVSEKLRFGGTPDFYGLHYLCPNLADIKTSNGVYESHWIQLAGYDILLREAGYSIKKYTIWWLPKDGRFEAFTRTDLRREKRIFKYLLSIYKERKANEPPF